MFDDFASAQNIIHSSLNREEKMGMISISFWIISKKKKNREECGLSLRLSFLFKSGKILPVAYSDYWLEGVMWEHYTEGDYNFTEVIEWLMNIAMQRKI